MMSVTQIKLPASTQNKNIQNYNIPYFTYSSTMILEKCSH